MLISMFDLTNVLHWLLSRQYCDGIVALSRSVTVGLYVASQLSSTGSRSSSKRLSRSEGSSEWEGGCGKGSGETAQVPLGVSTQGESEPMLFSLSVISMSIESSCEIVGLVQICCNVDSSSSVCLFVSSWRDGEGGHCVWRGVGSRELRPFTGSVR